MYSLITEAKKNIQEYKVSGSIGAVNFTESNVIDLSISNQSTDSNEFRLGGVYIGQLSATFVNVGIPRNYWIGKEIIVNVQIGLTIVPVGVYTIDSVSHTKGIAEVVAYDNMAKFDKAVNISEGASGSAYDFLTYACQQVGVTFGMTQAEVEALPNGTRPLVLFEMGDIETWRDFLYWVAVTLGSFATIDRDGHLVLRDFHNTFDDTIDYDVRYVNSSYGDDIIRFGTVSVYNNENKENYAVDIGSIVEPSLNYNVLSMGANPFLQTDFSIIEDYLTDVATHLVNNVEYVPCEVTVPFAFHYDLGDVLQFTNGQGSATNLFCIMGLSLNYNAECVLTGIPFLKNVKSKSDKNVQNLSNSSSKDSFQSYEQKNVNAITIGENTRERVLLSRIASNRNTKAEIHIEIDLETLANVTSKSYTSPFDLTDIFADVSAATTKGIVSYLINSEDSLRYPEEIWLDGKHVLHLMYILPVTANSLNTFEVYMKAERGQITIPKGGAWLYASGSGLIGESAWGGVIDVSDVATDFNLVEISFTSSTDVVTATVSVPVSISLSDVANDFNIIEMTFGNSTESLLVTLSGTSKALLVENGDNFISESGQYFYTEGD